MTISVLTVIATAFNTVRVASRFDARQVSGRRPISVIRETGAARGLADPDRPQVRSSLAVTRMAVRAVSTARKSS
jgi:hypothetical protein